MACDDERRALKSLLDTPPPECGPQPDDPADQLEWQRCQDQWIIWEVQVQATTQALRECQTASRLVLVEGYVKTLRVSRYEGDRYGGGTTNPIVANVVFTLLEHPGRGFGFVLSKNANDQPRREGMLNLLRDAIVHRFRVRADVSEPVEPPHQNALVDRVEIIWEEQGRPSITDIREAAL